MLTICLRIEGWVVVEKFPFRLSAVGTIALVALFTLRIIVFCHPTKKKLVFL